MNSDLNWKIIDKYFTENPYFLTRHNLDSFNDFMKNKISNVLKHVGGINVNKEKTNTNLYKYNAIVYIGTRTFDKIYIDKPVISDNLSQEKGLNHRILYPAEARLKNLDYSSNIYCDVEVVFSIRRGKEIEEWSQLFENDQRIQLGKVPIMLHSEYCVLRNMPEKILEEMGECPDEKGGYFIVNGKEKTIISQERANSNNRLYLKRCTGDDLKTSSHRVDIRSLEEDSYDYPYETTIRIMNDKTIMITIPYIRKDIPLFILFRALGIESDKSIIEHILLDIDNDHMNELLRESIYNVGPFYTQESCLNYLSSFLKQSEQSVQRVYGVFHEFLLPHLNHEQTDSDSFFKNELENKAFFIGLMVNKLLKFYSGIIPATDADSFNNKRVELPGNLLAILFREYYEIMKKQAKTEINNLYTFKVEKKLMEFTDIFTYHNFLKIINPNVIENGIIRGLKGNWGSSTAGETQVSKVGISQEIERKSFFSPLAQLRRVKLPLSSSAMKLVKPHLLHPTQWGMICPVETPDGPQVGIQKHMAISTYITPGSNIKELIRFLFIRDVIQLNNLSPKFIKYSTKVFVNGIWIGIHQEIDILVSELKSMRRNGVINMYISICWNIDDMELHINAHSGRMVRPLFIVENKKIRNYTKLQVNPWKTLIGNTDRISLSDYMKLPRGDFKFLDESSIEYLDTQEINCSLIAMNYKQLSLNPRFTHCEIHPSLMFGVMGLMIPFACHNQLPRDLFGIGQAKQSIGYYATNYQNRMDQTSQVLNYPQKALIETRFPKYIGRLSSLYGVNVIVAFASYTGYNQEDGIIFNKSSIEKGMFVSTHYSTHSESIVEGKDDEGCLFGNPVLNEVSNLKTRNNYTKLNENGIVSPGQKINEDDVIIGKYQSIIDEKGKEKNIDLSINPKRGTKAIVDKSYAYSTSDKMVYKVCLRKEKKPELGDKFSARHGQKGVMGMMIPASDMPYTKDGIIPDIILNPHCIPSRMTVGQFLECLLSKKATIDGVLLDGTSFLGDEKTDDSLEEIMEKLKYDTYGDEVLYNGMTGRQLDCKIFIGPTYYMRLKHIVQDKMHSRREGINQVMNRQPSEGRARDGGQKIGEMERDVILSHGVFNFLNESFNERSDKYRTYINNKTGLIESQFNENKGIDNNSDFSYIGISYSFKLFLQELQAMNIIVRLVT